LHYVFLNEKAFLLQYYHIIYNVTEYIVSDIIKRKEKGNGSVMKIEHYSFGKITIEGKTYTSDMIIYPGKVNASWWRKQGHNLEIADLVDVLAAQPEVLVVGTGAMGLMKVPKETISHLESKGIEVHVVRTGEAVELFNKLQKDKIVIAAFHLTC
jgi:hypothetical protein